MADPQARSFRSESRQEPVPRGQPPGCTSRSQLAPSGSDAGGTGFPVRSAWHGWRCARSRQAGLPGTNRSREPAHIYPESPECGQESCPPCYSCYAGGWQKCHPSQQRSRQSNAVPVTFAALVGVPRSAQPARHNWQGTPALSYPIRMGRSGPLLRLSRTPQTFPVSWRPLQKGAESAGRSAGPAPLKDSPCARSPKPVAIRRIRSTTRPRWLRC